MTTKRRQLTDEQIAARAEALQAETESEAA